MAVHELIVIGGGLAGAEAAWQAAERGVSVQLCEMRPQMTTPAHKTDKLAELVCSNSLGSTLPDRASGLLKAELRLLGSLLLRCAEQCAVPAGGALAVDRDKFAALVTDCVCNHPNITLKREEVKTIPASPCIIATGPLTANTLAGEIASFCGQQYLHFYDAIAPIVEAHSIDFKKAFRASRYDRGERTAGDYINCPLTRQEYESFVAALLSARAIELRDFEREDPLFFEGCLPIEQIARRGKHSLAFGPMRPVGLIDPRTGNRPYAVLQLRQDNMANSLYNMVGFQTNLRYSEQQRVFRMIPGLENAEFARYGEMHRNTFLNAPAVLEPSLQARTRASLFFAGQITGVEGYAGNIGTGLLAGINAVRALHHESLLVPPPETMLGALCHYIAYTDSATFQPMKANFGLLPPLELPIHNKRMRYAAYARRALSALVSNLAPANGANLA